MIKIENTVTPSPEQWRAVIRGMRNPLNSWEKSDSIHCCGCCDLCNYWRYDRSVCPLTLVKGELCIGPNDLDLMKRLRKGGPDDRKFMRMITVCCDITAPLYWWKEFDTYKVGTVANSCSTMHKIHAKEFTLDDFSHEHLTSYSIRLLENIITALNHCRKRYIKWDEVKAEDPDGINEKKDAWWQMIQLLPSSYNQKRTVMLNYEVLTNMYHARKNHKLDEWHDFCDWIKTLPYSELITGE